MRVMQIDPSGALPVIPALDLDVALIDVDLGADVLLRSVRSNNRPKFKC
ncbi:MAG: hypothetical protein JRM72_07140 [Nitrososphaerota archaeon]|nr:hypothetical protein [Nitrososphaerota archaeon]